MKTIGCVAVALLALSAAGAAPDVGLRAGAANVYAATVGQATPALRAAQPRTMPALLATVARPDLTPDAIPALRATVAMSGPLWFHQSTITNTIGAGFFGSALALSGTTALVGAPALQGGPPAVGVYVRDGAGWALQATLSGGAGAAWFGASVSLSGDTALVGAPQQGNVSGAAYIFVRHGTTWTPQAAFTDPAPAQFSDDFGFSVALSGDTALIAAPGKNNGMGRAYVYVRQGTTWTLQATLSAPDGAPQDDFGYALALSGDSAVIGAPLKNTSIGAVYVFARAGTRWRPWQELTPTPAVSPEEFGNAVAVQGDTIAVGAPSFPAAGSVGSGAAYIFACSGPTWGQQAMLTAQDGGRQDQFGWSVALSGATVVIGADYAINTHGDAYVFARNGTAWSEQALLAERHGAYGDFFGSAVALYGNTALIAANLNRSPNVYVYVRVTPSPP